MATKSTTTTVSVDAVTKVVLMVASTARREWLIRNNNPEILQIYLDDSLIVAASWANNILNEENCQEGFGGKIEGLLLAGGPVDIEVTTVP